MKKIFALALAAVMTAGMTTVAFAADSVNFVTGGTDRYYGVKDSDGTYTGAKIDTMDDVVFEGGDEVALYIFNNGDWVKDKDELDRYKVSVDWTVGETDAKPEIKMVKSATEGYVYAVTFTLPEAPETKTADLIGEVTVYKSTEGKKDAAAKFNVALEYGYEVVDPTDVVTGDEDLTDADAVKFDYDDVVVLTFGNDFEFEVDVTGQGKLNVKNNTDFNKEFAAMYDYANIDFLRVRSFLQQDRCCLPVR